MLIEMFQQIPGSILQKKPNSASCALSTEYKTALTPTCSIPSESAAHTSIRPFLQVQHVAACLHITCRSYPTEVLRSSDFETEGDRSGEAQSHPLCKKPRGHQEDIPRASYQENTVYGIGSTTRYTSTCILIPSQRNSFGRCDSCLVPQECLVCRSSSIVTASRQHCSKQRHKRCPRRPSERRHVAQQVLSFSSSSLAKKSNIIQDLGTEEYTAGSPTLNSRDTLGTSIFHFGPPAYR